MSRNSAACAGFLPNLDSKVTHMRRIQRNQQKELKAVSLQVVQLTNVVLMMTGTKSVEDVEPAIPLPSIRVKAIWDDVYEAVRIMIISHFES